MSNIVLNGDPSTGHGGWPAVPVNASSSVTVNGVAVALDGDPYDSHTNPVGVTHGPHGTATCGVTINGKKVLLHGDPIDCGDSTTATSAVSIN